MWNSPDLKNYLDTTSVVHGVTAVHMEWNLNDPSNIDRIGNYRHRPTSTGISRIPLAMYDPFDTIGEYTGATTSDIVIEGELDNNNDPTLFLTPDDVMQTLFSLDDCFTSNRPRSGINKILMLPGRRWLPSNNYVDNRPRYYPGSKQDVFKYWTSFRNISPKDEPNAALRYPDGIPGTMSVGISKTSNGMHFIEDAVPFVVYKNKIHTNRITIKMQTHTASEEGPGVIVGGVNIGDPVYGYENQQTPKIWKLQALRSGVWGDIYSVTESTVRSDNTPIIGPDGHVEIAYGLRIPSGYTYVGRVTSTNKLPDNPYLYDAYLVADGSSAGFVYTYDGEWHIAPAVYDWHLVENDYYAPLPIDDLNSMNTYYDGISTRYRDVDEIQGLRMIVTTMNVSDATFDLIEISPRLIADVTGMVESYTAKAAVSSMADTDLPVGYLLPGTGDINLLDTDSVFNDPDSIFSDLNELNIKFMFYEGVQAVDGQSYYIPIRTMYSEAIPPKIDAPPTVSFELRDGYWLLEKTKAPSLFMKDVSLSVAVATLLDYIGFSNYTFKRENNEEFIIPFFYTSNDKTVAEILQDLARASQTAMFFDENNNLTIMFKEWFLSHTRPVDLELSGNSATPHIMGIASVEKKRYNDGRIDYNERYIQRSISSLQQASFLNEDQTYVYKPVLLWEASGSELVRANNEMGQTQSAFSLGACALNQRLSSALPTVVAGRIVNNVIDVGESIYWLPRYNGYFYANGEIIKFDAVQYAVQGVGNVWISSNQEYQEYLADLPFYGKIYPTGRIRIFVEPELGIDTNGYTVIIGVRKHGRGQFQTPITDHESGLADSWSSTNVRSFIEQDSAYLFQNKSLPGSVYDDRNGLAKSSQSVNITVNGIVKNHFRNVQYTEAELRSFKTARAGTLQSSALVLQGPKDSASRDVDNVSVIRKTLDAPADHVGARMRVIGEVKAVGDVEQTPQGEMTYYTDATGAGNVITGGSGGVVSHYDPIKQTGYFLEIVALSNTTLNDRTIDSNTDAHNIIFYKNMAIANDSPLSPSVPVKMWGGRSNIVVDTGEFVGMGRQASEEIPNVYDIAIEHKVVGGTTRLFLYLNGQQLAAVDDPDPLPVTNTYGLFSRGTSKVMFENTYAIRGNTTSSSIIAESIPSAFGDSDINIFEAMTKYAINGIVQNAHLDGINTSTSPSTQLFYDEFGTILRECAYFNIKFDKAFPAMRARISPTFNKVQGYFVSGFTHNAYGAEFLIFNATDKALNLDDTTGNYLRIQGVAFTQSNQRSLTVDDYYNEVGSLSDSFTSEMGLARDPLVARNQFRDIRIDRRKRGKQEFSLSTEYVQRQDDAESLMGWLAAELTMPRLMVGIDMFPYPLVQLGDIVSIDYTDTNGIDFAPDKRFVVYNIEYEHSEELSQKIYLVEV